MSEFKLPHVEDLDTNSYLIRQLIENFKAIEQEDNDLQREIDSEDNKLNGRIDDTNTRLDKLDEQKATHDDVEGLRKDLQSRINHLYAGDPQTIKAVVTEILEEKGVI